MLHLEIKKTPDGRTLARRKDGRPLSPEDRQQAKLLADTAEPPLRACVVREEVGEDGAVKADLIYSAMLEDHLWLVFDLAFRPGDGLAVYYPEELPALKSKSIPDLKYIHNVKLVFPGRIVQEGAVP